MKKTLKSLLAGVLAVLLLVAAVPMNISVEANAQEFTSGDYTYTVEDGNATITKVDKSISGDVVIPETLGGYTVASIGNSAFYYCTNVESIEIPATVKKIGNAAFAGCSNATSVTIADGVKNIGKYAFEECRKLKSIEIPASVETVGDEAFAVCSSLESITFYNPDTDIDMSDGNIPYGTTIYGYKNSTAQEYAHRYNMNFVEMENPNKVTSGKCGENLTWEYDGNGTVYIRGNGEMSLSSEEPNWRTDFREAITTVIIEDGVTSISDLAFYGCTNLENVTLPETLKSIGETAFENCRSLTKITIPESVTDIGVSTFAYCSNLKEITFHSGITKIGAWMFMDCTSLKNVVIPDGVTVISGAVFAGCSSLESVTIPATVTTIHGSPFSGCTSLTDVYFLGCEQSWNAIKCNDSTMGKENMSGLTNQTIHFANENHTTYKPTIVTKVTCTKDGFEKRTYTCGCTESVTVLATGHKWGNWKVTKAATVEAEGKEERACTACMTKEIRSITKLPSVVESIKTNETIKTSSIAKDSVFALAGQSVADLKKSVSADVKVLDKNSKAVSDKAKLATGMQMVLTDEKGNVLDKITVVVPGDVNGDGEVKAADARSALRAAVKLDTLSDCEKSAADLDNTSKKQNINSADARYILRAAVGLENTKDWLKDLK